MMIRPPPCWYRPNRARLWLRLHCNRKGESATKPDCSHLVHLLYARAGLIYPYEDSRVLYRGISDFQRVKTPQAGDLAVWLGHVGIVLSPEEKTFLSSVRSGIITESWTAPHWVRRGRPRFYRYRIGPDADMNLLARIMNDDTPSAD